jgi:hypothetical protein
MSAWDVTFTRTTDYDETLFRLKFSEGTLIEMLLDLEEETPGFLHSLNPDRLYDLYCQRGSYCLVRVEGGEAAARHHAKCTRMELNPWRPKGSPCDVEGCTSTHRAEPRRKTAVKP